jgi:hypothetical protein
MDIFHILQLVMIQNHQLMELVMGEAFGSFYHKVKTFFHDFYEVILFIPIRTETLDEMNDFELNLLSNSKTLVR